jgi:hypothetical protein
LARCGRKVRGSMCFNRVSPPISPHFRKVSRRGGIVMAATSGVASFLWAVRSRVRKGEGTFVLHWGGLAFTVTCGMGEDSVTFPAATSGLRRS